MFFLQRSGDFTTGNRGGGAASVIKMAGSGLLISNLIFP